MTKTKLNFRFHNPNTAEDTAEYITQIFLLVNQNKLKNILHDNIAQIKKEKEEGQ